MTSDPEKGNLPPPDRPRHDRWTAYGQIAAAVAAIAGVIRALLSK